MLLLASKWKKTFGDPNVYFSLMLLSQLADSLEGYKILQIISVILKKKVK